MPKSNENILDKILEKLDDISSKTSNVTTSIKSLQDQLGNISDETKSVTTRMKNLEDQIDTLKHHKNDEIQDMEGNTSTIPYPTKISKVSGNLAKRKPVAEDVKDALAILIPSVPADEIYNSVLKHCTARSDEVVKTVYNNKPPTWKHVPASTRAEMYLKATKLIAKRHGVNMERCENNWLVKSLVCTGYQSRFHALCGSIMKDRDINDDDKNKRDAGDESESEEADEGTESESENNEAAVSQPQKRKSKQVSGETSRSHKKAKN
ncbi:hypothetical protein BD560DRAFT_450082 [Blakeslea trispora]|nr:hypothetical protein BD560DRAFT_450082 [Blakeslea trispora]